MSGVSARRSSCFICWNCLGSERTCWMSSVLMNYLVILVAWARNPFIQTQLLLPSLQWLLQRPSSIPPHDATLGEDVPPPSRVQRFDPLVHRVFSLKPALVHDWLTCVEKSARHSSLAAHARTPDTLIPWGNTHRLVRHTHAFPCPGDCSWP